MLDSVCPWTKPGAVVKTFLAGLPLEVLALVAWELAGCFRFREGFDVAALLSSVLAEKEEVPGIESLAEAAAAADWGPPFEAAGFFREDGFSESCCCCCLLLEPLPLLVGATAPLRLDDLEDAG